MKHYVKELNITGDRISFHIVDVEPLNLRKGQVVTRCGRFLTAPLKELPAGWSKDRVCGVCENAKGPRSGSVKAAVEHYVQSYVYQLKQMVLNETHEWVGIRPDHHPAFDVVKIEKEAGVFGVQAKGTFYRPRNEGPLYDIVREETRLGSKLRISVTNATEGRCFRHFHFPVLNGDNIEGLTLVALRRIKDDIVGFFRFGYAISAMATLAGYIDRMILEHQGDENTPLGRQLKIWRTWARFGNYQWARPMIRRLVLPVKYAEEQEEQAHGTNLSA